MCILKQEAFCTKLLENSKWRLHAWRCTRGEAGKKEDYPLGCFLSLPDSIEDLLGAHASFQVCHLSHQGAAGTGWEQAVLVPMVLHKKAFTNNEALKHPEQKCQQLELGSVVLWRKADQASGQRRDFLFCLAEERGLQGNGEQTCSCWLSLEKLGSGRGLSTLVQIRVCSLWYSSGLKQIPKKSTLLATELGFLRLL